MDKGYFETLARYNRWANNKLYDVVEEISVADFERDAGAYFGSLQGTLNHILFADWAWCLRLKGKSSAHLEMGKIYHPGFTELRAARTAADNDIETIVEGMSNDRLASKLVYKNIAGVEYTVPVAQVLGHLFNHATHHRGQAHCLLTQISVKAPSMDMVYYILDCQSEGIES